MRATSLPSALPVATAALALLAAFLMPPAVPSAALAERWLRPVHGEVARSFSYSRATPFASGMHRGVDLAAPPGTTVRAACGGRVIHAGPVAGRDLVVSVRCGRRRVTYLPLASAAVRAGARIGAGARLGAVGTGHGGLHFGVRIEGDPFGYVDPLPLVGGDRPIAPPALAPRARPRLRPIAPRSRPAPRPRPAPALRPATDPHAPPQALPEPGAPGPAARRAPDADLAPWPVWAGLALALSGAAGSGTVALHRRRRRRAQRPVRTAEAAA